MMPEHLRMRVPLTSGARALGVAHLLLLGACWSGLPALDAPGVWACRDGNDCLDGYYCVNQYCSPTPAGAGDWMGGDVAGGDTAQPGGDSVSPGGDSRLPGPGDYDVSECSSSPCGTRGCVLHGGSPYCADACTQDADCDLNIFWVWMPSTTSSPIDYQWQFANCSGGQCKCVFDVSSPYYYSGICRPLCTGYASCSPWPLHQCLQNVGAYNTGTPQYSVCVRPICGSDCHAQTGQQICQAYAGIGTACGSQCQFDADCDGPYHLVGAGDGSLLNCSSQTCRCAAAGQFSPPLTENTCLPACSSGSTCEAWASQFEKSSTCAPSATPANAAGSISVCTPPAAP